MRKKLFILTILVSILGGCSFAQNVLVENGGVIERNNSKLSTVETINLTDFKLNNIADDFIQMDDVDFNGKYKVDMLYQKGIKINDGIRFTNRFNDKIIGDTKIGTTLNDFIHKIGKPQFKNEEVGLIGYKTEKYYLIVYGKEKVEEISLLKRKVLSKGYENILCDFIEDAKEGFTFYDSFIEKYNDYSSKSHIRGGGWIVRYPGIEFEIFDGICVTIYNDFEGTLTGGSKDVAIKYIDEDSIFKGEGIYYSWENYLEEDICKEGITSPNKEYLAYSNDSSTYEHAYILLRYVDNSKADQKIYPGYFTDNLKWLNNRYLFFTADFNGIFIYDLKNEDLLELISSFENTDVDYKEYEFRSVDESSIKYINQDDEQVILTYEFNDEGDINIRKLK